MTERIEMLNRLTEITVELKSLSGQMIIASPFEMQAVIMAVKRLSKEIDGYERGVRDMASLKESPPSGRRA